jgi:hypothetical protein
MAVKKQAAKKQTAKKQASLPHPSRITSEDSHDMIVEAGGKVVYVPKKPPLKPSTYAEVCEAAGATDPRRFRP